jgi:hypothetical protein
MTHAGYTLGHGWRSCPLDDMYIPSQRPKIPFHLLLESPPHPLLVGAGSVNSGETVCR